MNNEGKFKKSLKDLVNSKEFEFDEANWAKASEMIEASRGVKSWASSFGIVSSLLLVVAGIAGAYLLYPSANPELASVKSNIEISSPEISQTKQRTIIAPVKQALAAPVKNYSSTVVKKAQDRRLTINNTKPETSNLEKETLIPTEKSVEEFVPTAKAISEENSKSIVPTVENDPINETIEKETKTTIANSLPVEKLKEESVSVLAVAVNNSAETKKIEESKSENEATSRIEKEEPTIPGKNSEVAFNNSTPLAQVSGTKEEKVEVTATTIPENAEQVASVDLMPNKLSSEPPKGVGIYPLMPKADSSMLENDNASRLTYDIKEKPVLLSIEAGVSYLYGWKNPGQTDANGYNPFVGINFFQTAYNKFSVSLGLQYTSISNLNYSSHTTKVSQLGLGEESTVTVFTPTKIHYLVAPLRVHYRLNQKNIAGLGCNFAYLLTVESDVETYHQTLNSTDGNTIYKDKGYTQGFSPLDVQLSAFYRHRLRSNLSFNAEVFYGLVDAKDNAFFRSNVFERNTGLKISLVYNILKK